MLEVMLGIPGVHGVQDPGEVDDEVRLLDRDPVSDAPLSDLSDSPA